MNDAEPGDSVDLVALDRGPHERHPLRIGLSAAAEAGHRAGI